MKPETYHKNKKGFSLLELVVSVAIFSVILLVVISFFLSTVASNSKTKADREVQENSRKALELITYEIKGAKSIYTPTTTANQLSLETSRYLPSDETDTFIDFFLCGTALCLKKESQNPIALTSDDVQVASLSFTQFLNGTKPSVQVNITVNYNSPANGNNYASVTLTSTASLRSY